MRSYEIQKAKDTISVICECVRAHKGSSGIDGRVATMGISVATWP